MAAGIPARAADFDCLILSSVSGHHASGDLAWVGTEPYTLVTMVRVGVLSFSSQTPCNTLMSAVKITEQ